MVSFCTVVQNNLGCDLQPDCDMQSTQYVSKSLVQLPVLNVKLQLQL